MKKALVTGGAGFIGSYLVDEMVKRSYEVTVLDPNVPDYLSVTNKRQVESVVDVDVIFHEAACGFASSTRFPEKALAVNAIGTLNILECMREKASEAVLIFGSSGSVYGKPLYSPQDEAHPCNPDNPYAISKHAAERYVSFFARKYGLKAVCLRYYNVVGIGQDYSEDCGIVSRFIKSMLKGKPIVIEGDGTQKRCFTSVEDVVDANILASENAKAYGCAFNIAGGETTTVNELAEMVCGLSKKPIHFYHESSTGGTYDFEPSIDLARKVLGYSPKRRLRDVLPEVASWIKDELTKKGEK